ncbi:MAG: AMP-binding protein [Bacteroidaceae bacterium]|nr:AMP-binding protein [Bacteroidaceae bacterium]
MGQIVVPSYNKIVQESIQKYWDRDSMSDHGLFTFKYKDVAEIIEKFHILYAELGIQKGDKIALCGRNLSRWGAAFFSIITYGAVAVPILHEFHPSQVHDIVNHSEAKLLFVGDKVWPALTASEMPVLEGIISLADYSILNSSTQKFAESFANASQIYARKYPQGIQPSDLDYHKDQPDELAIINYTSGTTSNSKGVMLPYRALWSNCDFAKHVLGDIIKPGDNVLSMLPMAHMYGMAFEFTFEFISCVHIHFLTKMASPTVLMQALAEVKPIILIVVPLIIEKVVRKAVLPKIETPKMQFLLKVPIVNSIIKRKIREGLTKALGGNFYEVIIGGAALNHEIEKLLHDIGFHYTVGYGATECAPIITYEDYDKFVPGSCGKNVLHQELKILSPDPQNIPGEILTRGLNVMLGYYKNEEATEATLDKEGWYHTGDLGVMDRKGNLFIKGRCKNMLLGANGQNIYPEEIEDKLSNMKMVAECVVIQKGEKLYGLVYPDQEQVQAQHLTEEDVIALMEENRKNVNPLLPAYAQLSGIKIMKQEFEKTPKRSIKRFLYANEEI